MTSRRSDKEPQGASFGEHLASFRTHLIAGAASTLAATLLALLFADSLVAAFFKSEGSEQFLFLTLVGPLAFKLKLAGIVGIGLTVPVWIALLVHFAGPALSRTGARVLAMFGAISVALGGVAVAATFLVLGPLTVHTLSAVDVPGAQRFVTAESYLDLYIVECILAVLVVELPVALVLLAASGLVDPHHIAGRRRVLYLIAASLLALVTPTTDALSLIALLVLVTTVFECGLVAATVVHRHRQTTSVL